MPLAREGTVVDLENPSQRARLAGIVETHTRGMRILTVNIFDLGGTIIYSTNADYIGYRSIDNPGLASCARRSHQLRSSSAPSSRPIRSAPATTCSSRTRRSTSSTLAPRHSAAIIGVIELYQDARPITAKIAQGEREIALLTAGLMVVLFVALFEIVRRGHVRIVRLSEALALSNRELEARVAARTREIEHARERLRVALRRHHRRHLRDRGGLPRLGVELRHRAAVRRARRWDERALSRALRRPRDAVRRLPRAKDHGDGDAGAAPLSLARAGRRHARGRGRHLPVHVARERARGDRGRARRLGARRARAPARAEREPRVAGRARRGRRSRDPQSDRHDQSSAQLLEGASGLTERDRTAART